MKDKAELSFLNHVFNQSIRTRIIVFSILITVIPASGLGWLFYHNNKEMLAEKTEQELVAFASTVHIAASQWFQARGFDIKVFSSSFVLTENLTNFYRKPSDSAQSTQEIEDFFRLLVAQFEGISSLMLFDHSGKLIVSTAEQPQADMLGAEWFANDAADFGVKVSVGASGTSIMIALPVLTSSQIVRGWIAASIPVSQFVDLLKKTLPQDVGQWILVDVGTTEFKTVLYGSSDDTTSPYLFTPSELGKTLSNPNQLVEIIDLQKRSVYAVATALEDVPLTVVLLRSKSEIYANIMRLKNMSFLLTAVLMLATGILAIGLARSILRPLNQLKEAAAAVSEGNLSVNVNQLRDDELGQVITVFNEMVENLALSHNKLELLSITDALTGLYNRKRMMSMLSKSVERFRRYDQVFSVVMLDIDHFKLVNDQYGHQAGDAVLEKIGQILLSELRTIDVAARYGGEEFVILLDQIDDKAAYQTAERIRMAVQDTVFTIGPLTIGCTLSLGVTTMFSAEQSEMDLIGEADAALYIAKGAGRNQTMVAHENDAIKTPAPIEGRKKRKTKSKSNAL